MAQRVIPVAITAEYVGGDGVTLGAAGSHSSVVLEYDFRAAGPQWEGTTKYVLWTNPQGNSTNRVNLGVDKLVEGYGGKVYHDCPTADAMCVAGWCEMVVVGVTVNNGVETVKIKTEPSRFRVLPATGRASDNEGIAATVADQLQTEIEVVDSRKVNKPISPYDPDGEEGQVLVSLGEGATKWVDAEAPTEDVVERVLSQHPEWTTTVQDGAITGKKLKPGEIGGYRPEQFGAKGDGVTDDTAAIKNALEAAGEGGTVVLEAGARYLVKETLQMQDRQTLDGNGATIVWEAAGSYDASKKRYNAPHILEASGSVGAEIAILERPRSHQGAASAENVGSYGSDNRRGFTYIKVGEDPGLETGDRIAIQAIRNALAPESGAYWCGTPTGTADPTYWAEILVVNDVEHETGTSVWTVRCTGTLTYPYYLPGPEEGVDISAVLTEARHAETKALLGLYVRDWNDTHYRKPWDPAVKAPASTIRKVNFLQDVTVRDLRIEANGKTHHGSTSATEKDAWVGNAYGNTIYFTLCEGLRVENVRMHLTHMGRGFAMFNCWRSWFVNSSYEVDYTLYTVSEAHTYTNAFTFASCWDCGADGCRTLRAGQSFDTSYAGNQANGEIRCPPLYITVRDCEVVESIDSAATNHSGAWGQVFEGCRFINCARPMAIRSPMTVIRNCSFTGLGGDDLTGDNYGLLNSREVNHLNFAEPTIWGCVVEGCAFFGGKAIHINPYNIRAFNFVRGNYVTQVSYVAPDTDPDFPKGYVIVSETQPRPVPPENRFLGIRISGNIFHQCNCALYASGGTRWVTDKNGAVRDYAKQDVGIRFTGNHLLECGAHYAPVHIESYTHGCEISGNDFVRCVGSVPNYRKDSGAGVTVQALINIRDDCVRMTIRDNRAIDCGGSYKFLYTVPTSVTGGLGTKGLPAYTEGGNQSNNDLAISDSGRDDTVHMVFSGSESAFQGVATLPQETDAASSMRSGLEHEFGSGTVSVVTWDTARVSVSPTALSPVQSTTAAGCLLRSWGYINFDAATNIKWRTAIYDQYISRESWERIAACWDAGVDDAGNTVSFATQVVLDEEVEEIDPDTGESTVVKTRVTYPAPINKALRFVPYQAHNRYIGGDPHYTVNRTTGVISVVIPEEDAPEAPSPGASRLNFLAFHEIPTGFAPVTGTGYFTFTEVLANDSKNALRINTQSSNIPSLFPLSMYTGKEVVEEPEQGLGPVYAWSQLYSVPEKMDLGAVDAPWQDVYAETLTLGQTQVSEAQLTALLALLD